MFCWPTIVLNGVFNRKLPVLSYELFSMMRTMMMMLLLIPSPSLCERRESLFHHNKHKAISYRRATRRGKSPSSWPPMKKYCVAPRPSRCHAVCVSAAYLHNLISYHQPSRVLRSSSQLLLEVPRTKTEFGRRAFSSASPQIWNDIPLPIRYSPSLDSFKRHLKTFLFT